MLEGKTKGAPKKVSEEASPVEACGFIDSILKNCVAQHTPLSENLLAGLRHSLGLVAGNPQDALNAGSKADDSRNPLDDEPEKEHIHRTFLVAFAGRFGCTKETPRENFPAYFNQLDNRHPTVFMRDVVMALLNLKILKVRTAHNIAFDQRATLKLRTSSRALSGIRSEELLQLVKRLRNLPQESLEDPETIKQLESLSTRKLRKDNFKKLKETIDKIATEERDTLRAGLLAEVDSSWAKLWYQDQTFHKMLFFNLVLGLNGGDMEGVIKGILKDVLPDL